MKHYRKILGLTALGLLFALNIYANHVDWIQINGPITPVTVKYIDDAIKRAEKHDAVCLVIQMDTPGGLMSSTWSIDKTLLADHVPVIVYIAPSGGRAASAGVFISYAANLVAMAPSTNIGSAHPVSMMGKDSSKVMMEKVTNDAVAHIKGLAAQRGRNGEWAEKAVRESVNITEKEALELGVIDLIAKNGIDLLTQLDGRIIPFDDAEVALQTENKEIKIHGMNWSYKILDKIADPNIAFLFVLLGFAGIYFELRNPGGIFPGAIGVMALIVAGFAFQVLPINAVGILLLILGVAFFILEAYTPTFGLLTTGGIISMSLGAIMLYRTPDIRVSTSVWIPAVIFFGLFAALIAILAYRAQKAKVSTGNKGLVGEKGEVVTPLKPEGQVAVHGEIWKAISEENLKKGEKVVVEDVEGIVIKVKRVKR